MEIHAAAAAFRPRSLVEGACLLYFGVDRQRRFGGLVRPGGGLGVGGLGACGRGGFGGGDLLGGRLRRCA